jgi:hypothetical protein
MNAAPLLAERRQEGIEADLDEDMITDVGAGLDRSHR